MFKDPAKRETDRKPKRPRLDIDETNGNQTQAEERIKFPEQTGELLEALAAERPFAELRTFKIGSTQEELEQSVAKYQLLAESYSKARQALEKDSKPFSLYKYDSARFFYLLHLVLQYFLVSRH